MSEKSIKKERRRSSSSSSYSSTSTDSSSDAKKKTVDKNKEQTHSSNPLGNVGKMRLDIGYKIQQEELSESDDSSGNVSPLMSCSKSNDIVNYPNAKTRDRSKSLERKRYRSRSNDRRRERSCSKDSKKDCSQNKGLKKEFDSKSVTKLGHSKSVERKGRSRSIDRKRERSRSRDKRKRRSRSREQRARSHSRDKKRDRSRSRERRRERSRSREKRERKGERSKSIEKRKEKYYHDSHSPIYKDSKSYGYSKRGRSRDKSRERSSKRSRSRSRSRSRPHKRSRSRSKSFDRSKRLYDKKFNKLSILEKLGIELKLPEGQTLGEAGTNASGFSIPSYYNPSGVNPLKYAQQMQKRRLIWGSKKQEGEPSTEKKEEEKIKTDNSGPESVWKGTTFSQDQDGKLTAKFKRLMGIKDSGGEEGPSGKGSDLIQKQEEMFSSMEKQYEVARVSTHTHRGLGLGFGVHLPR